MWHSRPFVSTALANLPGRCQVCGHWPAQPVCTGCLQRFALQRERCQACASPLSSAQPICGACLTRPDRSPLSACVALVDYDYPWDGLIARWKFQGESGWSSTWADLLMRDPRVQALWQQCSRAVPVPVSTLRLGERGFNQAWELLKAMQRRAPAPQPQLLAQALLRVRETPDQHSLARDERLRNLRGALLAHPTHAAALQGQHVLLVDDVSTTGATLEAAAQALLEGGAARVSACVLARTPPPH